MTNSSEISELRVREVLAKALNLTPEQAKGPLELNVHPAWDSMGHMQLVVALERDFGVRIPDFAIAEMTSVPAIVKALRECA